jgi:Zn-finger nucleic acid-binding protein
MTKQLLKCPLCSKQLTIVDTAPAHDDIKIDTYCPKCNITVVITCSQDIFDKTYKPV